jgi:CBS domain containing-hemolysin-like protein
MESLQPDPTYWQLIEQFLYFDPDLLADPDIALRIVLQVFLLMGSAFFSGSETALFSLSRLDLQQLMRSGHPRSETLQSLLDSPRRLIISLLCGNELINIAAVANMTGILVVLYGPGKGGVISVVVMVPLLLLFGEVTPKTIAVTNPVRISAGLVATPLNLWVRFVSPLRWLIRWAAERVTNWIVGQEKAPENLLQLDEFRSIVDEVTSEGELDATESFLIHHLLDAGVTEIVEIMTPRTRVSFIDGDLEISEMVSRFQEIRHSRVPVYRGHPDNIIGMLHLENVLPLVMDHVDHNTIKPGEIISPPIVVPPTKKVDEMFDYFKTNNTRVAIVLNEFGGVEGVVTMRDVLTFIFGHLSGEVREQTIHEEREEEIYEVPGDMRLVDFNNLTNFDIRDPRMTSIGGVAFRHLDRLPRAGDEVVVEGIRITVLEVQEQRIARLRVARDGAEEEEDSSGRDIPAATGRTDNDSEAEE